MSYKIKKSDGTDLVTLAEGLVDTANSSLSLVGKNVSNFGLIQNENFLYLLEHFASAVEPVNKIRGQAWYDTNSRTLKYYNGGAWTSLASMEVSSTQPDTAHDGYFWFDSTNKKLYINTGTDFLLVGPENTEGYGDTKMTSELLTDVVDVEHPVIKMSVGGEVLAIVSKAEFMLADSIDGFTIIRRGINFKNVESLDTNFTINGRSKVATFAGVSTNIAGGTTGNLVYQSGTSATTFLATGSNNTVLFSNGSIPEWKDLNNLISGRSTYSTSVSGGAAGSLVYQAAQSSTTFLSIGSPNSILTVSGTFLPSWKSPQTITVGYATTATTAITATTASTAVTQALSDSSRNIATTEFVHSILPQGAIILWSGDESDVPTGWRLCNGNFGTPNLADRFIVGAGNTYASNTTGGGEQASLTTGASGTHNHTGHTSGHAITVEEMPEHGHLVDDIRWSEVGGVYSYNDPMLGPISTGPGTGSDEGSDGDNGVFFLTHGTYKTGGNGEHNHSIASSGTHVHSIDPIDIIPPYYALCYIMKVV